MAKKIRPGTQGDVMGREVAGLRRGAPGKRYVGERAAQSRAARREELARVTELAREHRLDELRQESVPGILLELAVGCFRLARSFAVAPFRILDALRRARAEGPA
jgi:hypothetical protein